MPPPPLLPQPQLQDNPMIKMATLIASQSNNNITLQIEQEEESVPKNMKEFYCDLKLQNSPNYM